MTTTLRSTLLPIFVLALCLPAATFAKLKWESERLNIPARLGQEEVIGIFKFTNVGEAPIKILKSKASCGCTVPELEKDEYQPGESGELKAVFTIGSRVGSQRKTITVTTDDPDKPETHLVLTTDIPEMLMIRPRIAFWKMGGDAETKVISLKAAENSGISISGVEESSTFTTELVTSEEDGSYQLKITPNSTGKRIRERINLIIDDPYDYLEGKTSRASVQAYVK